MPTVREYFINYLDSQMSCVWRIAAFDYPVGQRFVASSDLPVEEGDMSKTSGEKLGGARGPPQMDA